jgi:hypothetical protein
MTPLTAEEFFARTGQKRGVREHNRQVRAIVKDQHAYVEHIIFAASERIEQRVAMGIPIDWLTVWNDFDPDTGFDFQTAQRKLPKWRNLSEYMKFQIGAVCTMGAEGYSFTARLNPKLESIWEAAGYDFYERIKRQMAAQFREAGITDLALAYVIEGKTKKGTRTNTHLHGFFFFDKGQTAPSKVKSAIEAALHCGLNRIGKRRGRDVKVELIYDTGLRYGKSPGRWGAYSTKHASKPDDRLPKRRIYMSTTMSQIAKVMWGVITEAPIGRE